MEVQSQDVVSKQVLCSSFMPFLFTKDDVRSPESRHVIFLVVRRNCDNYLFIIIIFGVVI